MSSNSSAARSSRLVAVLSAAGLTLAFATLLARVVQLQVSPGAQLRAQMSDRVTKVRDMSIRGDLVDRTGRAAAVTRFGYRVAVDPTILKRDELDATIVKLATAMGVEPDSIGTRLYAVIASNDDILAKNPPQVHQPTGLRAILVSLASGSSDTTSNPADAIDFDDQRQDAQPTKPTRFVPLGDVLTDQQVANVRALKLVGVTLEQRPIREYPSGTIAASIIGLAGLEKQWGVGAERRLDDELTGTDGSVSYTHDRFGKPLWMEPGQVRPAESGADIRLSIDMELQRIAYEELMRGLEDADAAGGRCVLLDPLTGEVLAMVDIVRDIPGLVPFPWADKPTATPEEKQKARAYDAWVKEHNAAESQKLATLGIEAPRSSGHPRYITMAVDANRAKNPAMARNRCIEDVYEPGSTFKSFVWSVITELGVVRPDEVLDTENGRWTTSFGRYVEDVHKAGSMTWSEVLVQSSNIGMIKGALKLTPAQMRDICVRFGFGKKTGIELPGEGAGIVTPLSRWSVFTQSSVAHGYEIAVTPLQMVRAFSAFARPGELAGTLPQVHLRAIVPEGGNRADPKEFQRGVIYRVIPSEVAVLTRTVMAKVAETAESKMKDTPAGGWRYTMFGKSGTAEIPLSMPPAGKMKPRGIAYVDGQYNSSFLAAGPTEQPRLVVLVVVDDPGGKVIGKRQHYGSWVAAPVVRRVMERSLTYLGTAPSPKANLEMAGVPVVAPEAGRGPERVPARGLPRGTSGRTASARR